MKRYFGKYSYDNRLGEIEWNMVKRFFGKFIEEVDMDYLIRAGFINAIQYFGVTLNNYNKRRDVGFKIIESLGGAFNETGRKVISDLKGEEFKEDKKAIEFIK